MGSEVSHQKLLQEIVTIVRRTIDMPHYCIFLFGSRASGTANPRSDYDVAIESDHPISAVIMSELREAMDALPVLQKIDLVNVADMSADVRELAFKTRKVLYEQ